MQSKLLTTNEQGLSRSFKVSGFAFEVSAGTGKAKQANESMASAKWQQFLSLVQFQKLFVLEGILLANYSMQKQIQTRRFYH